MDLKGMPSGMFPFFLILLALTLVLVVLGLRSLLLIRKRMSGAELSEGPRQQPMEFVVGTFQELVAKLKEKERELEELRSRAERRADHYESYSENIFESVPSGLITFDVDGRSRDTRVFEAGEAEGVCVVRLDLAALRDWREREVWGNRCRRPETYGALVEPREDAGA
ncbi:MAG: hypothetical protein ACWGSD_13215 [Thermodesulfobacteriota bacterium]